MRSRGWRGVAVGLALASVAGCGGGDGGTSPGAPPSSAAPAPSPSPTPSPSAAAFAPVPMHLFEEALYDPGLVVLGHGTLAGPLGASQELPYSKFTEANGLAITYDGATAAYRAEAGIAGKGVLFQVGGAQGGQIPAVVADTAADARDAAPEIYFRTAGKDRDFRYVARAFPWANTGLGTPDRMFYFGAFGIAQPSRPADVPAAGTARYTGVLDGFFTDDPGGTGLGGDVTLDFSYATLGGAAPLAAQVYCLMGCSYPGVDYRLEITRKTSANTFEGDVLLADGTKKGRLSGILAGPGAAEILIELTFAYSGPGLATPATFAGIVTLKKTANP